MNATWRYLVTIGVCFVLVAPALRADDAEDEKLFLKVMNRLLKNELLVKEYPEKFAYPPKAFIKPNSAKEMNAYASAHKLHGAVIDEETDKLRPVVMITQGFMEKVIKGDENSLAVIMGHELAHLTKDHVTGHKKNETTLVVLAFGRDHEIEADLNGMRYAIAAGYPYKKGVAKAMREMRANTKYSSFEGLSATHPTWEERLMFLDREQAKLWSAMSAFQNGYVFLEMEQYLSAQQCFKAVTAEFPDCHEAWANLGYARLMQYCDGLDSDDLRRYGIGQIVTGAFYTRPESLEAKVRGVDEKLWKDAVKAMEKALELQPNLVLPRASLGVAYLVHPDGKNVKSARKHFEAALDRLQKDPELKKNMNAVTALLVNAGVADLAAGENEEANRKFVAADGMTANLPSSGRTMDDAILFNLALTQAAFKDPEGKREAFKKFELYLRLTTPDSAWWPIAFAHYTKLGEKLDLKTQSRVSFFRKAAPQDLRVITSVKVGKDVITLSEPAKDAVDRLGKGGEPIPLFPDSKIIRWRFLERGIDVLAKDKVLAIFLTGKKAPPVVLHQVGVGGNASELKIGMSETLAKDYLKDQRAEASLRYLADTKTQYHFYPRLGLGVRYENARVAEIAVAQVPRRMFGEK